MTTTLPRPTTSMTGTVPQIGLGRPPTRRSRTVESSPGDRRDPSRSRGTVCATGSGRAVQMRRPLPVGWAVAAVAGAVLAVGVWAILTMGAAVAESTAPAAQGTTVVHVRSGESLSALARRVAPDQPTTRVLDDISALNHLTGAGLTAGEPLLAPRYR